MSKKILLFGAGKSATCLINYLGKCSDENNWQFIVCDADLSLAQSKTKDFSKSKAVSFDVADTVQRSEYISDADLVISLLPPGLHFLVARSCVDHSKNLLTASYIDSNIKSLEQEILDKGLLFLGEMGLDPGIDHMSAMKMIHQLQDSGSVISSFKSHCGGLVSPESDDNPWHYKITWNPANVVMAGNAGAQYLENGQVVSIPYQKIFQNNSTVDVPGLHSLAWYANRDSLNYPSLYDLQNIKTFIRTTLRYPAFCTGWNKIIQLDLTNQQDEQEIKSFKSVASWFASKKEKLFSQQQNRLNESDFFDKEFSEQIEFLGLQKQQTIPEKITNSASLLQWILESKLVMKEHDKDMIVMLHEVEYLKEGKLQKDTASLIVKGDDKIHTAMAKTVGMPLGIAARLILEGKITIKGLHIPVIPEIYIPVLQELENQGIRFSEKTKLV